MEPGWGFGFRAASSTDIMDACAFAPAQMPHVTALSSASFCRVSWKRIPEGIILVIPEEQTQIPFGNDNQKAEEPCYIELETTRMAMKAKQLDSRRTIAWLDGFVSQQIRRQILFVVVTEDSHNVSLRPEAILCRKCGQQIAS